MGQKIVLACLIIVSVSGVSQLPASASTPKPSIKGFSPVSGTVGTKVTITGPHLGGATTVTFNGKVAEVISDTANQIKADVPAGNTTGYIKVKTPGGTARSLYKFNFLKPLDDSMSLVSDDNDNGYCSLLSSGGVDCWGFGAYGQLGNGAFYHSSPFGSAVPVIVKGVGGTGALTGVTSLVSDSFGYCALLTSGGVDCWGDGSFGDLGNGTFYTYPADGSPSPVAVESVGGNGTLSGVTSLVGGIRSFCALLTSGGVDCWGNGQIGELGNGTFYSSSPYGSATPVVVEGVGGSGSLAGVRSVFSQPGIVSGSYCALLTSGGLDCWGDSDGGQLGNGTFSDSATPVVVEGVGGSGSLTGVSNLFSASGSYCAVLTSGAVDCWGNGEDGELGNGAFYTSSPYGSDTPVEVEGVGGNGALTGVTSLVDGYEGYCALLTSGAVNCWGYGAFGQLGNGILYTSSQNYGSDAPVQVEGVGGTGTLSGVTSLVGTTSYGNFCALLTSGSVDCWGFGEDGELGNGTSSGSATPVTVEDVAGTGTLTGVTSLVSDSIGNCSQLASGEVDCWGLGTNGELGDASLSKSARPVEVVV